MAKITKMTTVQLDRDSHEIFKRACDSMPQTPPLGRVAAGLVRWFARQDDAVKTAVMSGVDRGMEAIYAKALRDLADELGRAGTIKRVGELKAREPASPPRERPTASLRK